MDAAAHRGALAGGGPTIAVLGVSAGRFYPAVHLPLFSDIIRAGGAIVSEYPPGAASYRADHATRNRLIAALSLGVVVAQAGPRSGSLHTAAAAKALGREIVVAPRQVRGNLAGTQGLVEEGANARGQWRWAVSPIVNCSYRV